ncbi:hypothetical protein NHX12_021383 [Muraenolepis orangiensis]|uniref:Piezo TM1-24 domain-containing protein n=1 Tax=Muraenolepis orangiensis TaxID=630683 RepID=A0A9Q0ISA4_9TELE|nr:hypothetical protein NHX12_021383 [Muraenolepis orangiensis]
MVSLVSVDCTAPWWLRVNGALSWYHYTNPLLLLLLYYTVATVCTMKVTNRIEEDSMESEQPIRTDDIIDPDDLTSDITAEKRREMWRSTHYVRTSCYG